MRTTVILADDVAAAVERLRQERSIGLSEALNELVRTGLVGARPRRTFEQQSHDMGQRIDVTDIGEATETLDRPSTA